MHTSAVMKFRVVTFALTLQLAASVLAADASLTVGDAWIRTAPPKAPLAGYMTLENRSGAARVLVSASSSDFGQVTLHRVERVAGSIAMTETSAVQVPAHGRLVFEPGGYHLMLEQPRRPLRVGDSVPVTLRWADGSALATKFEVRGLRGTPEDHAAGHDAHSMAEMHGGHR